MEEAIELANTTDYGLVAGVWTKDIDIVHYVATGGVQIPFGEYKNRL